MTTTEPEIRRSGDTRERILKEAERLYHEGGYDKISLQEVAEALGIKKAALFYHYKNKQELFYAMLIAMLNRMNYILTNTLEYSGQSARAQLLAILQRMTLEPGFDAMHFLKEDYELLTQEQKAEAQRIWNGQIFELIRGVFQQGMESGELKGHNTETAAYMYMNLWTLLPRPDSPMIKYRRNKINSAEYIEEMLNLFLGGLRE